MKPGARLLNPLRRATDLAAVLLGGVIAFRLRWDSWAPDDETLPVLVIAGLLTLLILPLSGAYKPGSGNQDARSLLRALAGVFAVALCLIVLAAGSKTTAVFSRLWMMYWMLIAAALLVAGRIAVALLTRRMAGELDHRRRVCVVGNSARAGAVYRQLLAAADPGLLPLGIILTGAGAENPEPSLPVLGDASRFNSLVAQHAVEEIWLALPIGEDIEPLLAQAEEQWLRIRCVPDLVSLRLLGAGSPVTLGDVVTVELDHASLSDAEWLAKRSFDLVFAALVLLLTLPLTALIALAVKLDSPGPVIFRQRRHGWRGEVIEVYKFRTMYAAADGPAPFQQAVPNDARVTRVGRFLRRFSLDELPQFVNVLQGRLSVVGPRPHPVELNSRFQHRIDAYMQRHRVMPGITGWAQVNGYRGQTDTEDKMRSRVEHDLWYADNWSLALDLKIILLTLLKGFTGPNAL